MIDSPGTKFVDHLWILLSVLFTACSQLLIKWQVSQVGSFPSGLGPRFQFLVDLFTRPWIIVALVSTFLAGVTWMIALGKFELSYAFPFYALNFLVVFLAGIFLFSEAVTASKIAGLVLILIGVIVLSSGKGG